MNKIYLLTYLYVTRCISVGYAETPEDRWRRQFEPRTTLAALEGDPAAQTVFAEMGEKERLRYLRGQALKFGVSDPIKAKALEMIKNIPGHCTFYRDQILSDKDGSSTQRLEAFEILAVLKTEESINILGEFLFDPTNPTYVATGDTVLFPSNRKAAMMVLSKYSKIEGAPVGDIYAENEEFKLKAFQDWWLKTHPRK